MNHSPTSSPTWRLSLRTIFATLPYYVYNFTAAALSRSRSLATSLRGDEHPRADRRVVDRHVTRRQHLPLLPPGAPSGPGQRGSRAGYRDPGLRGARADENARLPFTRAVRWR
jgi:hypothetical protein